MRTTAFAARAAPLIDLNLLVREARALGHRRVVGVDEAGAGALAGPLVCAAVSLDADHEELTLPYLTDSKRLSATRRRTLHAQILAHPALQVAVRVIPPHTVDSLNIFQARKHGLTSAAAVLACDEDMLYVDGNFELLLDVPQRAVIGGDALVSVIAAASIVAKQVRDEIMRDLLHRRFPQYGFDTHVGYPTKVHKERLAAVGPCVEHRFSYRPVREALLAHPGGTLHDLEPR